MASTIAAVLVLLCGTVCLGKRFGDICDTSICKVHQETAKSNPFYLRNLATAKTIQNFALRFQRQAVLRSPNSNIFYSPLSIVVAFGLLEIGAVGETEKELKEVFGWDTLKVNPEVSLGQLLRQVVHGREAKLNFENSVWVDMNEKPTAEYKRKLSGFYNSALWLIDFARKSNAAERMINGWVAKRTEGMIKDILPPSSITSQTRIVLINTVFFNSPWLNAFSPKETKKLFFHLSSDKKIRVPMMIRSAVYHHAYDYARQCEVLRLPYAKESFSMIIVLPNLESNLVEVEKKIDIQAFDDWGETMSEDRLTLRLPKFKFSHNVNIKSILSSMGLKVTFTSRGDFSKLSTRPGLYVDDALHKAAIEVSEEGTTAAATTAIIRGRTLEPEFTVDRPFLFYIVESTTNTILFSGRITDPTKLN